MIWQNDTAFFQVQILGARGELTRVGQGNLILPQDVVSFTLTEEFNQQTTGSFVLRDPKHVYSRILRNGTVINISFGYKNIAQNLDFLDPGFDLAATGIVRRGFQAFITAPSGGGGDGGEITYNASFLSFGTRSPKEEVVYESGKKKDCVAQVMARMGLLLPEIDFERGNDIINTTAPERQYESDFRTLARWAGEWKAVFRVGHTPNGKMTGVFIDPWRIPFSDTIALMGQVSKNLIKLKYRVSKGANVQNYTWQRQDGNSGQGDGVILYLVNGKVTTQRYHLNDETVTAWRLVPERIQSYLESEGLKGGPTAQADFVKSITDAQTFNDEKIKRLFDPITLKTAPDGIGYSMTGRMLGTPYATAGMTAQFEGPFPDCFTDHSSGNAYFFYFQKVTHSISLAGYFTDFEIVDTYAQSPVGGANLLAAGG